MVCSRIWIGWLSLVAGVFWAGAARATDDELTVQKRAAGRVPVDQVREEIRERVRQVLDTPTLYGRGPTEAFCGQPDFYRWLLDHPDRGVQAWRRLGAKCQSISDKGCGTFMWTDGHGSELRWRTAYDSDSLRVWYAEGKVRPALLMPPVSVQLVVLLRHGKRPESADHTLIFHQADVFLRTDSKTAVLMTKMLGSSAPRLAEQCLSQLETFFSGLTWYMDHHPDRAEKLLAEKMANQKSGTKD
jgi:hypothetical protein